MYKLLSDHVRAICGGQGNCPLLRSRANAAATPRPLKEGSGFMSSEFYSVY